MNDVITRYRGRYLSLLERDDWEYASRSNASGVVVIVAATAAKEILLVEQYRKPVRKRVIELPAGLIGDDDDANESVIEAANRELKEETGYTASSWNVLLACPSSAGMSDEVITFVEAVDPVRTGAGGGDPSEEIIVHAVALGEVDAWLQSQLSDGKSLDPKIYAALYWLSQPVSAPAAR